MLIVCIYNVTLKALTERLIFFSLNNGIATFQTNLTDAKASVTSYVVASNPEVLEKLMSDANKRQIHNSNNSNLYPENIPNPSGYTVPASSLNTITVDFASSKSEINCSKATNFIGESKNESMAINSVKDILSNTSRVDFSHQNAFVNHINMIKPKPEIESFLRNNPKTNLIFKSHCPTNQIANRDQPKNDTKQSHVPKNTMYLKESKLDNLNDVNNTSVTEQKTKVLSSSLQTSNSSVMNPYNINKVIKT